ncbi:MAG: hypothetical protein QXG39_08290 [Candidatus Aenigmatarchaeota archaeon]
MRNFKPYDALKKQVGKEIKVYLKDGSCYEGKLVDVWKNEDEWDLLVRNFHNFYLIKGKGICFIQLFDQNI